VKDLKPKVQQMISAVSSNSSMYTPVQKAAKAAIIQVEATIAIEKSNQAARDAAAAKAIEDARQNFLQTQYVGPARAATRLAAQGNERLQDLPGQRIGSARTLARDIALGKTGPQDQQPQNAGPARKAARLEALNIDLTGVKNTQSSYQDLRSGCHAGPKPASAITAELQYRQILNIVV